MMDVAYYFTGDKQLEAKLNAARPYLLQTMPWPLVQPEYVFCREAIEIAGAAMFGSDWTGSERLATLWLSQPELVYHTHWREKLAMVAKLKPRPSIPPSLAGSVSRGVKGETQDEFEERCKKELDLCNNRLTNVPEKIQAMQTAWTKNYDATQRLRKVARWLGDRCRSGAIRGALQYVNWPDLHEALDCAKWNGACDIERWAKDGGWVAYLNNHKYRTSVFMHSEDLQREIATLACAPLVVNQADLSKLSPDLQLAVRVALDKKLFGKGAASSGQVEGWIEKAAEAERRKIAPTKLKQMSAVMRYPDGLTLSTKEK